MVVTNLASYLLQCCSVAVLHMQVHVLHMQLHVASQVGWL